MPYLSYGLSLIPYQISGATRKRYGGELRPTILFYEAIEISMIQLILVVLYLVVLYLLLPPKHLYRMLQVFYTVLCKWCYLFVVCSTVSIWYATAHLPYCFGILNLFASVFWTFFYRCFVPDATAHLWLSEYHDRRWLSEYHDRRVATWLCDFSRPPKCTQRIVSEYRIHEFTRVEYLSFANTSLVKWGIAQDNVCLSTGQPLIRNLLSISITLEIYVIF